MYVTQWPETISTTICKKLEWKKKKSTLAFRWKQIVPLGKCFSNHQLGSKTCTLVSDQSRNVCSFLQHKRSKSRTAVKFLPQIPSFLSVIIASQLTNYRSVVFVFAFSDTTGEVQPVCAGLVASLLLVLLAKYIFPFLVQQTHFGSQGRTVLFLFFFLNVLPRKFHKKEDIIFATLRTCNLVQQAESSILHKKNTVFPFMKSLEKSLPL